jgi:hypothetical protein
MNFTIDYRTPNSLNRIKRGDDLAALLASVKLEGCRISIASISAAVEWSKTARSGKKYYIGCACTIRKGEAEMTEYTSF